MSAIVKSQRLEEVNERVEERGVCDFPPYGDDPTEDYIYTLKPSCPSHQIVIDKISFERYVVSPDASKKENQNIDFPRRQRTIELTEKQYQYFLKRLDRQISVPARYGLGKYINAKDYCILKKESEFSLRDLGDDPKAKEEEDVLKTEHDVESNLLVEVQANRNERRKK